MTDTPYPAVTSRREVSSLVPRSYIECANCLDSDPLQDGDDPLNWVAKHQEDKPYHERFRVVGTTRFSVPRPA
jgi:hypothetical protein